MKDEHDKRTIDMHSGAVTPPPVVGSGAAAVAAARVPAGKSKRLPRQSVYRPPKGAKPADGSAPSLLTSQYVVPVSSVARDWGISARRVRKMLEEGRLMGRRLDNGYWEVAYPYQYTFGTRGPQIKRQRELPESTYSKKKKTKDQFEEWKF